MDKRGMLTLALAMLAVCLLAVPLFAQQKLTTAEAANHIGETATVCGQVTGTYYAESSKGKPTFIDMDKFTVLIWGKNRRKFGTPETTYNARTICVKGRITQYKGGPEIVVRNPRAIETK
jgi:DNA/RNA endonuclease YhcR with UshA esterase domain